MEKSKAFDQADCYIFGYELNGDGSGVEANSTTPGGRPLWLHIDYSENDSAQWLRRQGISENVTDSLVRLDSRPRCTALEGGVLVILRTINVNPGQNPEDMVSLRIWLEPDRVITVRQRRVFSVQDLKTELERGRGPRDLQGLITILVERIADRIADYVEALEERVSAHEESIEESDANAARTQVSSLRREAATVRRFLAPQRDALDTFYRQAKHLLDDSHAYMIHEQADRIIRYVEDLDLMRERCLVLQEELMNRIAQEQNARMYVLSIVAVVFLPISFITGLFGMNVAGLPGVETPSAFLLVSLVMGVIVGGTVWHLRRRKWL